jgi:PKD repeat protein
MALLASAFPDATKIDLEQALRDSALDLGAPGPDNDYGHGRIDVAAAFMHLETAGWVPCIRPEINFEADPYPGVVGAPITFTSMASGGIQPYSYSWDVDGDGITDFDTPSAIHQYTDIYKGTVGLTVTDDTGCFTKLSIAGNCAACTAMTANFTADPSPGTVGNPITFTGTVSGGPPPYAYAWDLNGDGTTDCTKAECIKTYSTAYNGNVELTVTDDSGCASDPYSQKVTVKTADPVNSSSGNGGGGCFISTVSP